MNSCLKEVADVWTFKKSFHTMYKVYISSPVIANKIPLEFITKMLVDTDIRITRIYTKIMISTIANKMKVLQNRFTI